MPGLFFKHLKTHHACDADEVQDMPLNKMFFFKDKNQVVPKEEIEAACKKFDKYSARCIVMDGELMIQREDKPPSVDILFPEMEGFVDYYEIIVLGNESLKKDAIQPFVLLGGEKPELVCFIQGDISVLPEVQRKVNKMFKGADDFDDFWLDLKGSASSFQDIMKEDSCVMFFAHNDEFCAFQTSQIEKDKEGRIGVLFASVGGGGLFRRSTSHETVNRLQFEVPVAFPLRDDWLTLGRPTWFVRIALATS